MATKRERKVSILPQSKGNVIGIDAVGKVYPEDYDELLRPTFLKAINQYGSIRLLFRAEKFRGWSNPLSLLQDAKTMVQVRRHLDKVAIVTSPGWKQRFAECRTPSSGARREPSTSRTRTKRGRGWRSSLRPRSLDCSAKEVKEE